VSATSVDAAADTASADAAPVSHAPARAARTPERSPDTALNTARARGDTESGNDAESIGMPAAISSAGSMICIGTR
jgi:hypothetical protein